mmetsp:Transcript_24466/g.25093  ORF Transcript_24466/g.25093 Transcript_24466/m.25093 type:complete len:301 (-) Transcript_24466:395-1297(-)
MNSLFQLKLTSQFQTNLLLETTMNGIKIPKKKSVRFSEMCKVVLIPMRHEYSAAGIILWWTRKDFITFRQMYHFEKQKERELERQLQLELEEMNNSTSSNDSDAHSNDSNSHANLLESDSSLSPSPPRSPSTIKRNTILVITDQDKSQSFISQISNSMTIQPNFITRTHEEVASMKLLSKGFHFDAVIIDGTDVCDCFEENSICSKHSINRLSTINVVRNLLLSQNITLFVNKENINKEKVIRLCSDSDILTSDLMILTPDSWVDFQSLVESATASITSLNTAVNSKRLSISERIELSFS